MAKFACGRFPDGVVPIRTVAGIVDFHDGLAEVDDSEVAAALREVPSVFQITEDGTAPETPAPAVEDERSPQADEQQDATAPKASEIRAWAKENGVECPAKGKVPQVVRDAYDAAHAAE
jgi:Lsr2